MSDSQTSTQNDPRQEEVESPEIHFEPLVKLAPVETATLEENEEELFKMRSKLYRMDMECDPPEWKERGVGDVRILKHKQKTRFRILMRRDKTHKICCNHFITKEIKLIPNVGSDRAWVWSTHADFADEEVKHEQLAIRFGNAENAKKFKDAVEKCQEELTPGDHSQNDDSLSEELKKLDVKDDTETEVKVADVEKDANKENKTDDEKTTPEENSEKSDANTDQ